MYMHAFLNISKYKFLGRINAHMMCENPNTLLHA